MNKTQWPEGNRSEWEGWGCWRPNVAGQALVEGPHVLEAICLAIPVGGTLIEFGAWVAATAAAVADLRPDATVIAVDDYGDCHGRGVAYPRAMMALVNALTRTNLSLIVASTERAGKILGEHVADVVSVDADHSEAGCLADLVRAARIVRPGGTILVHDFQDGWPDVQRAVHAFVASGPWRIVNCVDSLAFLV